MANSFLRTLDKIGGWITYFRNFVLNSIFLFCFGIIALIIFFSIIGFIVSNGTDKAILKEEAMSYKILTINIGPTIIDNIEKDTPIKAIIRELNPDASIEPTSRVELEYVLNNLPNYNIDTVLLNFTQTEGIRLDIAHDIGAKIDKLSKENNIKFYAFAHSYNQSVYALASHANIIAVSDLGEVEIKGLAMKTIYAKDLLDNLKIDMYTPHVGTHKSAIEPITRNNMSPWVKEEYSGILNDLWGLYKTEVTKARQDTLKFDSQFSDNQEYLTSLTKDYNFNAASVAKANGAVDVVTSYTELLQAIATEKNEKLQITDKDNSQFITHSVDFKKFLSYLDFDPFKSGVNKNKRVAVVYGLGEIVTQANDSHSEYFTAVDTVAQLRKLRKDKDLNAIVLYINSPGGEVFAADQIRNELEILHNKGVKIVVYVSGMCASGGYWISTVADKIISSESAIVGSIGVFGIVPQFNRFINEYGLTVDGVANSDQAATSFLTGFNEKQKTVIQASINNIYNKFLGLVQDARHYQTKEEVDSLAQGKIYTANTALKLNLIDKVGNFNDALLETRKLINATDDEPLNVFISSNDAQNELSAFTSLLIKTTSKFNQNIALQLLNDITNEPIVKNTIKATTLKKPQVMAITETEIEF